jgi:hypothetical protein
LTEKNGYDINVSKITGNSQEKNSKEPGRFLFFVPWKASK